MTHRNPTPREPTHLEAGMIQSLVHGELSAAEHDEALRHQDACERCRAAIDVARRDDAWVLERLALLDQPVPAEDNVMPPVQQRVPPRARWKRAATWVALLGGTSVALAMPAVRVPVMTWLADTFRGTAGDPVTPTPTPIPMTQQPAPAAAALSGVSVVPRDRFTVTVTVAGGTGTIFVRAVDGDAVSVRASASNVSLDSEDDALRVRNPDGAGDYYIEIPRAARHVEVRVNATRLLLVRRGALAPAATPLGTEWTPYPIP